LPKLRPLVGLLACLILAVVSPQVASQDHKQSLLTLLPTEHIADGWSRIDTARVYEGEDLFSFIDGGASLFLEYGFTRVLASEFQNGRNESITLEVYEMKDPSAAYGIYSIRSSERAMPIAIGQEGSMRTDYIMFWKGNYYVSVAGSDSTTECRAGLLTIARTVDGRLDGAGTRPQLVELLPKKGLLKSRYIRGTLGLSTVYAFDTKDIVRSPEASVGSYHNHSLFLLRYGSATETRQRMTDIESMLSSSDRFAPFRIEDNVITVKDRKHQTLCFSQAGLYIVIAMSSDESIAVSSCKKAAFSLSLR
jgi:hypothetical protein